MGPQPAGKRSKGSPRMSSLSRAPPGLSPPVVPQVLLTPGRPSGTLPSGTARAGLRLGTTTAQMMIIC